MQLNSIRPPKTAIFVATILLLCVSASVAQQQVNLVTGSSTIVLPDGSSLPMWGYSCGDVVAGSTATCASANPNASGWSPVVITVPTGSDLQINLTNNLTFGSTNIPTSLLIVGQLGAGLGKVGQRTTTPSPNHTGQGVTWPIANTGATFS